MPLALGSAAAVRTGSASGRAALDRYRALGLAGAAALALGGAAAGALPTRDPFASLPLIDELRELSPVVPLAIAYCGLVLLVVAWLFLGRQVRQPCGPGRRWLITTLMIWMAPLCLAPPMFSRDVYSYAAQGWLVDEGVNPYLWGPGDVPGPFLADVGVLWRHTPAPYGPVFLQLARAVVGVTGDHVVPTVLGMRLIALAGVALLVRYLPRLAVHCGVCPRQALWLGVLNPLVLLHFVSGAHNDALLVGLVVAGLVVVLDGRPALGVMVCAAAVLLKAPAVVAVVFLVPVWAAMLSGRTAMLRAGVGTAVTAGWVVAAGTWLTGLGYGWVHALQTPGAVRNWLSASTLLGEAAGLLGTGMGFGHHTTDLTIAVFRGIGGVCALIVCVLLLFRTDRYHVVGALGAALTAIVLLGPVVQPWYLLWGFVLLAAGARAVRARTAVIIASAALSLILMPRGGMVDVSGIVPAVLAGLVVAAVATLAELLPLPLPPTLAALRQRWAAAIPHPPGDSETIPG